MVRPKGYVVLEETKKKISEKVKGHRGATYWKGKHLSNETKEKISKAKLGFHHSEITKNKISKNNARYWKGKSIPKHVIEASRIALTGKTTNKKNMTYEELYGIERAKEIKEKLSFSHIENAKTNFNFGMKGKHHKEQSKIKISKFKTEESKTNLNYGMKNKSHSQESKLKMSKARENIISPIKDTKIEVKIQNFLTDLKIEYFAHKYMHIEHGYQCDIFIPSKNLVIECDGDYWHGNPLRNKGLSEKQKSQRIKDNLRTEELREKGYKVLRLWENEINQMDLNKFKEILL